MMCVEEGKQDEGVMEESHPRRSDFKRQEERPGIRVRRRSGQRPAEGQIRRPFRKFFSLRKGRSGDLENRLHSYHRAALDGGRPASQELGKEGLEEKGYQMRNASLRKEKGWPEG